MLRIKFFTAGFFVKAQQQDITKVSIMYWAR